MKSKLFILFFIFTLILTTGLGCKGGDTVAKKAIVEPVELIFWSVFESSDNFDSIIKAYALTRPNVTIIYKKIRYEDYEKQLIDAWSNGTGPDIFAINNTWVSKYQSKILPVPTSVKIPVLETTKSFLKKETKAIIKEFPTLTVSQLKNIFPDIVYKDVVRQNQIYALPLSIDTLSLFYNKDHFNAAGIIDPPLTWLEVTEDVVKLNKLNTKGEFERSGIALGGSQNINRSNDILALLMMQNGTTMVNEKGTVSFARSLANNDQILPGQEALQFYAGFAQPSRDVYAWNSTLPESLDLFSAGKLSMFFGYSYQLSLIKAQAPKINFGIAGMPHLKSDGTDAFGLPINFANYWLYSVFKNSKYADEAWDFLIFLTTKQYQDAKGNNRYYAEDYLEASQQPPALKNLIRNYQNKYPELSPFATQILTADSWYRGKNPDEANKIFKQLINNAVLGSDNLQKVISTASAAVQQSY